MKNLLILLSLLISSQLWSQDHEAHKLLRNGDEEYRMQDYSAAEENYRKSLEKETTAKGKYNLGNTLYSQERFDEALKQYESVALSSADDITRSKAYHNLGNAHFLKQEYDKSVDAFKNSLRLNPSDLDTKKNLSMALRQMRMQQQQQQQQQQQESEENKDEENQD